MSYVPTDWKNGDIITEERLDHMEEGIATANSGGGVLVVNHDNYNVLNKTWQEIYDASETGIVVLLDSGSILYLCEAFENDGTYWAVFCPFNDEAMSFSTNSASGYPELFTGGG